MPLTEFFNPSSIAIIGVSHDEKKVGYLVAKNLIAQGYAKDLYLINPKDGEILGRKVITDIKQISKPIDLAVLAVPAEISLTYLDQLYELNVKNVIIYAAGFKETDDAGKLREQALIEKAHRYGMNILGPNCIGYVNTAAGINLTFLKSIATKGNIGLISQSGALGSILVDYYASHKNQGFSYFVSIGNKTILDECDMLEFMAESPETKVIGMYLEDVKHGDRFIATLKKVTKIKPVVVLKSGTTPEGSQAALSHTGGLVGDDQVYDAVFRENGVIRADNLLQFIDILGIYSFDKVPKTTGDMLILSNAGGMGVLLADDIIKHGLKLINITEEIKEKLTAGESGSRKISVHNPIDLLGDASAFDYESAIKAMIEVNNIAATIILLTPQANTQILETAKIITELQKQIDRPLYPVFMGEASVTEAHKYFEDHGLASFISYDILPGVLSKVYGYLEFLKPDIFIKQNATFLDKLPLQQAQAGIQQILQASMGKPYLNLMDSLSVLQQIGLPVVSLQEVTADTLPTMATQLQYPLVAKIASETITHKTEKKGVVTGVADAEMLKKTFAELTAISGNAKIYVQQTVQGHELFLGAKRDPTFKTVIILGLGGIYAELIRDVIHIVPPLSYVDFQRLVYHTRVHKLLTGFRGSQPVELAQVYQMVLKIAALFEQFESITELDINPLFIENGALKIVDSRIILKPVQG